MKLELFVGTTCPYCHLVPKEIEKQGRTDVEFHNIDLSEAVDQAAASTGPEQSLARIAAIEECRTRLRSNAAPLLAVEALMIQLRPQA